MSDNTVYEQLLSLLTPVLDSMGIELVELEYKREGSDWVVRLFIDKDGGVTLDDCADVSREVGGVLDVEDLIQAAYRLEVSSPGIDRPLKKPADYDRFSGHAVKVKMLEKMDPDGRGHERKTFAGELLGLEDGLIRLQQTDKKGGIVELPLDGVAEAHLDPGF